MAVLRGDALCLFSSPGTLGWLRPCLGHTKWVWPAGEGLTALIHLDSSRLIAHAGRDSLRGRSSRAIMMYYAFMVSSKISGFSLFPAFFGYFHPEKIEKIEKI